MSNKAFYKRVTAYTVLSTILSVYFLIRTANMHKGSEQTGFLIVTSALIVGCYFLSVIGAVLSLPRRRHPEQEPIISKEDFSGYSSSADSNYSALSSHSRNSVVSEWSVFPPSHSLINFSEQKESNENPQQTIPTIP